MDLLNENSLSSLLQNCYQHNGYRGAILFNTQAEVDELLNELRDIHSENAIDGVRGFSRHNPHIYFENGSHITLLTTANEGLLRGARFHEALLHDTVMDTEAMLVLQSHIREYVEPSDMFVTINEYATRAFRREYQGVWGSTSSTYPNIVNDELVVDKKSADALDDFLKSFTHNDTL